MTGQDGSSNYLIEGPYVNGGRIMLPEGRYQIQRARDYVEVYEGVGGKGVALPDGRYTVIEQGDDCTRTEILVIDTRNLPTHVWEPADAREPADAWEPAEEFSQPPAWGAVTSSVTLSGRTFTLPRADNYYQIQDSRTYESVWAGMGGVKREVPPGQYWIINLDTNQRTLFTVTGSDSTVSSRPPSNNGLTVNGHLVTLPDDGWYIIRVASNNEGLWQGQGGQSKWVPNGVWEIINTTTGRRTNNLVINVTAGSPEAGF